jgi:hypothetical protein
MSEPQKAPSRVGIVFKGLLCLMLAAVFGLFAWLLLAAGFSSLRDIRQLERAPRSLAASVLAGETTLLGRASAIDTPLTAPDSGTPTLYYHYEVEREERDEDGDTRWVTVNEATVFQPFLLTDESGAILIEPSDRARFDADVRHTRREGDLRYSETRIDPGDEVFVFGYADTGRQPVRIEFDSVGQYAPLISTQGEAAAHSGMTGATLFLLWLGLCVLSVALFALLWGLRVHVSTVYLATLSLAMAFALLLLSAQAARDDLKDSFARTVRDVATAEHEIGARLRARGIEWNGDWNVLGDATMPGYERLDAPSRHLLTHFRTRLALQIERTAAVRDRWPERLVAAWLPLPQLPAIAWPAGVARETEVPADDAGTTLAYLIAAGMLALTALFAWLAFRSIKLKRTIENLATSHTAGAAYGLVELKGEAAVEDDGEPLTGPLSQRPCVWYHYTVQERRGSGKNAKWVTIENRRVDRTFCLVDAEGRLPVDPTDADAIVTCSRSRQEGSYRYSERWIEPGTPLYVLGSALVDPRSGSSLMVCRGAKAQPFLLTDLRESDLMLRKARGGFALLNFATNFGNAAALSLLGASATLDGAGFLVAALVPLTMFAGFLGVVMYNDLVTLRQRVRVAWSNIEVSLLKLAELVPRLESVLKAYLTHEAALQTNLARLRDLSHGKLDQQGAGRLMSVEQDVIGQMTWLREQHPELKASELAMQLAATLVRLDNEVALMRDGYNAAVERYNTRCQQLPELLFAKAFAFKPATSFQADIAMHAVPRVAV